MPFPYLWILKMNYVSHMSGSGGGWYAKYLKWRKDWRLPGTGNEMGWKGLLSRSRIMLTEVGRGDFIPSGMGGLSGGMK